MHNVVSWPEFTQLCFHTNDIFNTERRRAENGVENNLALVPLMSGNSVKHLDSFVQDCKHQ